MNSTHSNYLGDFYIAEPHPISNNQLKGVYKQPCPLPNVAIT